MATRRSAYIDRVVQVLANSCRTDRTRRAQKKVGIAYRLVPLLLATTMSSFAQDVWEEVDDWNFDVYIDDKRVGTHRFLVSETDGLKQVQSDANFEYKFLFITAYRYEHRASERWTNNCLADIEASTNVNGKRINVVGKQTGNGFSIEKENEPVVLSECVMTFAYWNAEFLNQTKLLNPQTGEYLDVIVEKIGDETVVIRGEQVLATRFKLTAREVDVTLWYSVSNEWLGLESVAKGGRIIRYELS